MTSRAFAFGKGVKSFCERETLSLGDDWQFGKGRKHLPPLELFLLWKKICKVFIKENPWHWMCDNILKPDIDLQSICFCGSASAIVANSDTARPGGQGRERELKRRETKTETAEICFNYISSSSGFTSRLHRN